MEEPTMNVHLGDLEAYVQEKLERGGYASAAEVIREALRKMRDQEREDATLRAIESYVIRGIDPGPPDGISNDEWERRLTSARQRMQSFVAEGVESADRGELVDGAEARSRLREKQKSRRRRKTG
jgi:putative addiction module CopG family antidote